MKSKTAFKTIEDFLYQENKSFVIPNYQRGYKWSVKKEKKQESAVEKLLTNLIEADKSQNYFLQGLTVVEEDKSIILIDGQQRTTTLYLLLWYLNNELIQNIDLHYDIRESSKDFIVRLKQPNFDFQQYDVENKSQDVFYFKRAIEQMEERLKIIKKDANKREELINFILKKITILYIIIDKEKATKTFSMMNGSKASMLQEELVKAELLRTVSLPEINKGDISTSVNDNLNHLKQIIALDWETNAMRSRYAREWDKWLYWWNKPQVKELYNTEKPLGLLLEYYNIKKNISPKFTFDTFKKTFSSKSETQKQRAKTIFKELRNYQKSFEDLFNSYLLFNTLGLALIEAHDDKLSTIDFFIQHKHQPEILWHYAINKLIGATHKEIIENNKAELKFKAKNVIPKLEDDFIYYNNSNIAFKLLLKLNVEEDNKLKRKFDFTIWRNKSLEHIYPKSKVYHTNEESEIVDGNNEVLSDDKLKTLKDGNWLNRQDFNGEGSEHCIGNLVLLYGRNNSSFGNKTYNDKKQTYFNTHDIFESRHLLHTISSFTEQEWSVKKIQKYKENFINRFKNDYKIGGDK